MTTPIGTRVSSPGDALPELATYFLGQLPMPPRNALHPSGIGSEVGCIVLRSPQESSWTDFSYIARLTPSGGDTAATSTATQPSSIDTPQL